MKTTRHTNSDRGSVLLLVLVVVFVIGAVVVATATYATTTLRYGQVVEDKADRLSAAEGGMRDIVNRIDNGQLPLCSTAAGVGGTTINLPQPISGASVSVTCKQTASTLTDTAGWSIAITGLQSSAGPPSRAARASRRRRQNQGVRRPDLHRQHGFVRAEEGPSDQPRRSVLHRRHVRRGWRIRRVQLP